MTVGTTDRHLDLTWVSLPVLFYLFSSLFADTGLGAHQITQDGLTLRPLITSAKPFLFFTVKVKL